jgi:hypothetical protein
MCVFENLGVETLWGKDEWCGELVEGACLCRENGVIDELCIGVRRRQLEKEAQGKDIMCRTPVCHVKCGSWGKSRIVHRLIVCLPVVAFHKDVST